MDESKVGEHPGRKDDTEKRRIQRKALREFMREEEGIGFLTDKN